MNSIGEDAYCAELEIKISNIQDKKKVFEKMLKNAENKETIIRKQLNLKID